MGIISEFKTFAFELVVTLGRMIAQAFLMGLLLFSLVMLVAAVLIGFDYVLNLVL